MKNQKNRLTRFFKALYLRLVRMNDSPQRIAAGFGLGVFLGILPGTGPIASLAAAALFKVNKAAALLGSLITNTWLSVVSIVLSIKLGSAIMGLSWQDVQAHWQSFIADFRWRQLFELATLKLIAPVLAGYLIISLALGLTVYAVTLAILKLTKHAHTSRANLPRKT